MSRKSERKKKGKHASFHVVSNAASISSKPSKARKVSGLPMVVDGEPLRRAARQAHQKVRTQMELMEKQIDSFERQELPAYQRWLHLNFGPLLTDLRETDRAATTKEYILERVQDYQIWSNMSPVRAYAKVKSEMENRDGNAGSQDQDEAPPDFDSFAGVSDEEFREAYESASYAFERETGYKAPDFETFKQAMGLEAKQSRSRENKPDSVKARIRKLYRKIARSLHPDCSSQFSLREQQLWHRAQDAYRAGDITALETVLSHIEAAASGPLFASSVSDLLESTREMRTRVGYLEEDLQEARQHPAWRFTQKTPGQLTSLQNRVQKEINKALQQAQKDLASAEAALKELEFAYAQWEARKRKARKSKETAVSAQQTSFNF